MLVIHLGLSVICLKLLIICFKISIFILHYVRYLRLRVIVRNDFVCVVFSVYFGVLYASRKQRDLIASWFTFLGLFGSLYLRHSFKLLQNHSFQNSLNKLLLDQSTAVISLKVLELTTDPRLKQMHIMSTYPVSAMKLHP